MRLGVALDVCMTADAHHRAEMELAGATMLAVLRGEMISPRGLRWQRQTGGWSENMHGSAVLARIAARDRMAEIRRVNRDPCPRCNTRADIGCKHRRVA